ncbi:transporter, major facilitator domain protein [Propionibacterium acidifaciens F0233]|uniref:Transporter, major facilitator domain protein n=2 Tax=Propionibacterium acidifaciens TaxID=556499 RepID=U2PZU3_9ACTN|nr:transporter, major facilitator domain protein [Propionibacterium acidifaciens F0233]
MAMGGRRGLSARSGHQPHRPIGDLRLLPYMTADFTVSATQRGLVLSAFSWSYALMQIPAGSLIDGFGERIMVGASAWSAHPRASGRSAPG